MTRQTRPDDSIHLNKVQLVGTISSAPTQVELPSGDVVLTFRVTVARSAGGRARSAGPPRMDSVPCAAWGARVRRSVATWRPGDLVEVSGSVRSRFYRRAGTTQSRVEVEALTARVVRRARVA